MTNEEKHKFAELLISMSTDFLLNKINWKTYITNLKMISDRLNKDE